ncbi:GMC family oxidoreductase [Trichocoleus sp. FACHB-262]|nr:GMC family oxidoreductase [Trichocoleus sp. FACHB-262]
MPLNKLVEDNQPTIVQETTFSHDVLGRYICNTWDEAVNNGGAPFDAIVLGAGMFGAYCAQKIYRQGAASNKRVLVLEAGGFLVSEHVQNLARIGLNVPGSVPSDPGVPRETVWGLPWRGNQATPGLAYCIGGRSLYWGGWTPRLTPADQALWPPVLSSYLNATYSMVESEIGVTPSTDFITGALYTALKARLTTVGPTVTNIDSVEEAPLAVQGAPPASGLFSFDKYSSAPILVDAIREAAGNPDSSRRLFLVPRVHVIRLNASGGFVNSIEVDVAGQRKLLPVTPNCAVVLAMGAIESTRVALLSFPTPLMGRNLMAHLRTNITVRIRRSAIAATLPTQLETAAVLVRGSSPQGRFHLQFTASASPTSASDDLLFRMIPDLDLLSNILDAQKSDWVAMTVRGLGEMEGNKSSLVPNNVGSWINLSPFEADEFGSSRAWVQLVTTPNDSNLWNLMDQTALDLVQKMAGSSNNIEYLYNGGWQAAPPSLSIVSQQMRDGLGTTHHESGTLWMGAPGSSVTDENGRFHHIDNAYVTDLSIFPTVGSANPVLIGLVLARKVAEAVVNR